MKRLRINFLALLFIGVLCILSSCSKESLDGESGSAAVVWDKTSYNVSYVEVGSLYTSCPITDKYFILDFALEDSENPQKQLSFSCTNYIYGEKVDLTTDKYSSQIDFKDGHKTYWMKGGASNVKAGSYYKLSRKGNHIELTIDLVYSGDHGYEHTLKVRYSGELPENNYFPSENWQNEPRTRYNYIQDGVSYVYETWAGIHVGKEVTSFNCIAFEKGNREATWSQFDIEVKNLELGKKTDLSSRDNFLWSSFVDFENILPGSYMYVTLGKNDYEVTIDLLYKDSNGEKHHLLIEYNVYK